MPGYNTHRLFNYSVFLIIAALFYFKNIFLFDPGQFLLVGAGFIAGTEFITPDLDIQSKAINRWGPLKFIWFPYMIIFKHGKSSHNIIYGAIVRLLYIGLIIFVVYYLLFRAFPTNLIFLSFDQVLIFFAGIIIANSLHVMLDMLF